MIVSVGGDGTLSEVVGGFFDGAVPVAPEAALGVIAKSGAGGRVLICGSLHFAGVVLRDNG